MSVREVAKENWFDKRILDKILNDKQLECLYKSESGDMQAVKLGMVERMLDEMVREEYLDCFYI